jgi:phospholipase C
MPRETSGSTPAKSRMATLSERFTVSLGPRARHTHSIPPVTPGTLSVLVKRRRPTKLEREETRHATEDQAEVPEDMPAIELLQGGRVVAKAAGSLDHRIRETSSGYSLRLVGRDGISGTYDVTISYPSNREILTRRIPLMVFKKKLEELINQRAKMPFTIRLHGTEVELTFEKELASLHGLQSQREQLGHLEIDLPGPLNPDCRFNDMRSSRIRASMRSVLAPARPGAASSMIPEVVLSVSFETSGTEIIVNNFGDIDIQKLSVDLRLGLTANGDLVGVLPDVGVTMSATLNNGRDSWVAGPFKKKIRDGIMKLLTPELSKKISLGLTRWLLGEVYEVRSVVSDGKDMVIEYVGPAPGPRGESDPTGAPLEAGALAKIDHIVVLMMENRSFDHLLGYLSKHGGRGGEVDGLVGGEKNVYKGREYASFPLGQTLFAESPSHEFASVLNQIAGDMGGFVASFAERYEEHGIDPGKVMGYHVAAHVPVYDVLAREYAICDRWFAAHPGPTWPNRFYTLTGRLNRNAFGEWEFDNPPISQFSPVEADTIFDHLTERNVTWRYYEHGYCFLRLFTRYTFDTEHIADARHATTGFFAAARAGRLPAVSFIDPDFIEDPPGNDDHPPADLAPGQSLVGNVVRALQQGPAWDRTLLIITYDEHGGFYDHVTPPHAPDVSGIDRYGVRVPAFIVSPWVERGAVARNVIFDHSSILKTIIRRFCGTRPPDMGARVAAAQDLGVLLTRTTPRTDRPEIPLPPLPARRLIAPTPPASVSDERDFHALLRAMRARADASRR